MLKALYEEMSQAFSSGKYAAQIPLVFGYGNPSPKLLLIGEAPGEQETLQGKPFVGKAGKNLTEFLQEVGLSREELYITNVVKCRPTKISKAGRIVNRPPTRSEIGFFTPYLFREIQLLQPERIVTLGNVALGVFLSSPIGAVHGKEQAVSLENSSYRLFPLYHPASVIYNPSLKQVYHEDLACLRSLLQGER